MRELCFPSLFFCLRFSFRLLFLDFGFLDFLDFRTDSRGGGMREISDAPGRAGVQGAEPLG